MVTSRVNRSTRCASLASCQSIYNRWRCHTLSFPKLEPQQEFCGNVGFSTTPAWNNSTGHWRFVIIKYSLTCTQSLLWSQDSAFVTGGLLAKLCGTMQSVLRNRLSKSLRERKTMFILVVIIKDDSPWFCMKRHRRYYNVLLSVRAILRSWRW